MQSIEDAWAKQMHAWMEEASDLLKKLLPENGTSFVDASWPECIPLALEDSIRELSLLTVRTNLLIGMEQRGVLASECTVHCDFFVDRDGNPLMRAWLTQAEESFAETTVTYVPDEATHEALADMFIEMHFARIASPEGEVLHFPAIEAGQRNSAPGVQH